MAMRYRFIADLYLHLQAPYLPRVGILLLLLGKYVALPLQVLWGTVQITAAYIFYIYILYMYEIQSFISF